ncbi:unnamed protein product [Miscanthus lutarioriparius]|uniref:Uncharacterized protein n=1 Tax=Miscanthus lutarioriparius TaxID=422564 RepID=A0A811Q4K3_9POAL|nr:unnamed protein product [Miscanthus lutarioriparius]
MEMLERILSTADVFCLDRRELFTGNLLSQLWIRSKKSSGNQQLVGMVLMMDFLSFEKHFSKSYQVISHGHCWCKSDWLEKVLKENDPIPKLVTVVNPRNPSGAFIPRPMLEI